MRHRHRARWTSRTLPRVIAALSALVVVATLGTATSAAKPADPPASGHKLSDRIHSVTAQLHRLAERSAHLDERYNVAAVGVAKAQRVAREARQAAADAAGSFDAAHAEFLAAVQHQYTSGPAVSVGNLLTSAAPQEYLDSLTMESYLSQQFAETVRAERQSRLDAAAAKERADATLRSAQAKAAALATQRANLQREADRFQELLDSLTAQQQRQLARARAAAAAEARATLAPPQRQAAGTQHRSAPKLLSAPVSGAIGRVIAFAEAQVGKPYSYAASGPGAFDCSGLTMAAYARAGISLPHSAALQYNYGRHVSYSDLQPGDLIFLYSPIGHVELYVGHDLAVSAATYGTGVVYVHPSQDMGNYVGATRLIG